MQPFVALAKSANSPRAATDLVVRATSHPSTFVFAELLQTPQIQALAGADAEYASYLKLLKIFSYGTYADYARDAAPSTLQTPPTAQTPISASSSPPLPTLNDAQHTKLRQLSLLSLATDRDSLGYDHLIRGLHLTDASQLESLVMSAVYAGLVTAMLDPALKVVRISSVAPLRDVAPGAVPKMHAALVSWSQHCEAALADLDAQIAGIRRAAAARAEETQRWETQFKVAVDDEKTRQPPPLHASSSLYNMEGDGAGSDVATAISPAALGKRPMTLNMSTSGGGALPRLNKRGSNLMAGAGGASGHGVASGGSAAADAIDISVDEDDDADDDDDEAMDVDGR